MKYRPEFGGNVIKRGPSLNHCLSFALLDPRFYIHFKIGFLYSVLSNTDAIRTGMHHLMGQRHVNNANKCGHPGESTPHLNPAQSPFDHLLLLN
jgi:hypothetical protein